jgi:hypothetical protein
MSSRKHFTPSEDEYIAEKWGNTICAKISHELQRSPDGVRKRARTLGLPMHRCKRWTEKEDNVLRNAQGKDQESVAKELQRSTAECSNRARVLGIKSWRWHKNGNAYLSKRGYKIIGFTRAGGGKASKAIFEHKAVVESMLERTLNKGECVHHINGDKMDNEPENLLVCRDAKHHRDIHCTLDKLLPDLMRSGIIVFDRNSESYQLAHKLVGS